MKKFLLIVILAAAAPAFAGDVEAVRALENLTRDLRSMQAEFTQTVLSDELEILRESRGTFLLQRSGARDAGKFRWDYTEPFEQVIVGDGRNLWTYDPELEQATVKPMEQTLASSPASLLTGNVDIEKEFEVRELGQSGQLYWIGVKPRVQDTDFQRVRVGLMNGQLDTMELLDNLGQTTRIRFHQVQRNVEIPAERFRFTPPEGADVIGEPVAE